MSTEQTLRIESASLKQTLKLASKIGENLHGGEVVELVSDLGGGKTAFVRGLAKGLGSEDPVSSPSFTLRNEYVADQITLYHFDFYRLHEPGIMREELTELVRDPQAVVAVEWAEIAHDVLPPQRLTITIETTGEDSRVYCVTYPEELAYAVEDVA